MLQSAATRTAAVLACATTLLVAGAAPARAFDIKRTPHGALVRWRTETVTFGVVREGGGRMRDGELERALEIGLDAWRGMPGLPDLATCDARHRRCAPRVTIEAPDMWEYEASRLAVTVATYDAESGEMIAARVLINTHFETAVLDETSPDASAYDLASTVAHEIGHVLGLAESEHASATMWADGARGDTTPRTLDIDDEDAITMLYAPEPEAPPVLYGCNVVQRSSGFSPIDAVCTALFGAIVVVARARRRSRVRGAT